MNDNPKEARKYLVKHTLTPEDVVDTVPMVRYYAADELTARNKTEFQQFIDFFTRRARFRRKWTSRNTCRCIRS